MENKRIEKIEEDIQLIRENHLAHIQDDMSDIKVNLATVSTNVTWLIKSHWILYGAIIAGVITLIIKLVVK